VCNQGLGGVLGGINPGFTHFGGFRPILGYGLFSPIIPAINSLSCPE
jgi:hypothetical protein